MRGWFCTSPAAVTGLVLLVIGLAGLPPVWADDSSTPPSIDLKSIFAGGEPSSVADLMAMEKHQQAIADRLLACTVGIVVGPAHGSGVIISEDGFVLTAAHVAGAPNRDALFILPDGRRIRGKTLGVYRTMDAGLMKITDKGPWPCAELSQDAEVKSGQWVISTGHPGGYQPGRKPVFRVGRVLLHDRFAITTDCTLIGGDSGGPLFDMEGRVIGVNSRIGRFLTANLHVPVAAYHDTWDRLVRGDSWGHLPGQGLGPFIGVKGDQVSKDARVVEVYPGTPAEDAGLQRGDIILAYDGNPVTDFASLQSHVSDSDPGDQVRLRVKRGERVVQIDLKVGQRDS